MCIFVLLLQRSGLAGEMGPEAERCTHGTSETHDPAPGLAANTLI